MFPNVIHRALSSVQARPLLEKHAIDELIDPCLGGRYAEDEVSCMLHAAALCIRRDPDARPRMSQVSMQASSPGFLQSLFNGRRSDCPSWV